MFDVFSTISAAAVFALVDALEGCVDALAFCLPTAGLRLGHGLVLERIHAGKAPDGLLVEFHCGLRVLARRVLGIEGGEAVVQACARVHVWSVGFGWPVVQGGVKPGPTAR